MAIGRRSAVLCFAVVVTSGAFGGSAWTARADPPRPPPPYPGPPGCLIAGFCKPACWPPWEAPGDPPPPPGEPVWGILRPVFTPCPAPPAPPEGQQYPPLPPPPAPWPPCGMEGVCFPGQVPYGPLPPGYYGPPGWYS